jgi:hypothetical protein
VDRGYLYLHFFEVIQLCICHNSISGRATMVVVVEVVTVVHGIRRGTVVVTNGVLSTDS